MADDTIAFLEQVVGGPAYLVGHSDGAPVALLAALARPDLVRALVFGAGVFHHDGWAPGAIDMDDELTAFFTEYWGAVAPDGPEHFPVVAAKLDRMHREEPTLTPADLAGYPGPALVMVGDGDDEIPIEHTLALRAGCPTPSSPSSPAPARAVRREARALQPDRPTSSAREHARRRPAARCR